MARPEITGFGHVDLTVTGAERSLRWWQDVMGFKLVDHFERPGRKGWAMWHRTGVPVGLILHDVRASDEFNERAVGLDHLAFRVSDRAALEEWVTHLDQLGVSHSGIQEERGGPLIVFRDPDNIQLEVWAFDPQLV